MVRCSKCGTENLDDSIFCIECGNTLYPERRKEARDECFGPRREEDECFGLPHGPAILGMLIGLMIVVAGIATLFGADAGRLVWAFFLVAVGALIVVGMYRGLRRRW